MSPPRARYADGKANGSGRPTGRALSSRREYRWRGLDTVDGHLAALGLLTVPYKRYTVGMTTTIHPGALVYIALHQEALDAVNPRRQATHWVRGLDKRGYLIIAALAVGWRRHLPLRQRTSTIPPHKVVVV